MYEELLKDRDSLGIKPGLERTTFFLNFIGNPQNKFKSVLIGGTNGKGSVTFYLSNLGCNLTNLKIGRYISPHLIHWNERFVINEKAVDDHLLKNTCEYLVKKVTEFENLNPSYGKLTSFEIYTTIAFCLFAQLKVDVAFIEVGMGGRLDATNVLSANNVLCSVITNVSLDHMEFLGNTIENIAYEKAGIIKKNNCLVTGATGNGLKIIEGKAKELTANLIIANDGDKKNDLSYIDKNIAVALKTWESIAPKLKTTPKSLNKNNFLKSLQFSGRYHLLKNEKIILDGAHNPDAACQLRKLLDRDYKNKTIIYIVGMLDKDFKMFLQNLIPYGSVVICTEPKSHRATKKEILQEHIRSIGSNAILSKDTKSAIDEARKLKNDIIVITGSLYLIGEVLGIFNRNSVTI